MSCNKKRRVKFILNKQIKFCTKEIFKWINIIAIALIAIMTLVLIKYKLVYNVIVEDEQIGYIENVKQFEKDLEENIKQEEGESLEFIDIKCDVQYKLTFIDRKKDMDEEKVASRIKEDAELTYKYYAVTVNKEQKSIVNSLDEAEKLVAELKEKHKTSMNNANVEINQIYTTEKDKDVETIKVAKKEIENELEKIEDASVNGIYLSQKPISGFITSRFGERESIRSHAHTGLDIAAPYGTKIKAAASGTVTWSGDRGSYGNLIIVDCGNGVQIYYGHCSKLIAKVGDKVEAGDIIAQVGSTGNSTGNHLHFEIRVNGVQVNPQRYIYN